MLFENIVFVFCGKSSSFAGHCTINDAVKHPQLNVSPDFTQFVFAYSRLYHIPSHSVIINRFEIA
jgi:hypothetical protein